MTDEEKRSEEEAAEAEKSEEAAVSEEAKEESSDDSGSGEGDEAETNTPLLNWKKGAGDAKQNQTPSAAARGLQFLATGAEMNFRKVSISELAEVDHARLIIRLNPLVSVLYIDSGSLPFLNSPEWKRMAVGSVPSTSCKLQSLGISNRHHPFWNQTKSLRTYKQIHAYIYIHIYVYIYYIHVYIYYM